MNNDEIFINYSMFQDDLVTEEINSLFAKAKTGDLAAREKLIIHNIRLVIYRVVNQFGDVNYDKNELVSIGNIGLIKAIDTFDFSRGFTFSTYAVRCIDNEILMFLRSLTKYRNVDSFDRPILADIDKVDIKLQDVISDSYDFTEKYFEEELHETIRELVNLLPNRDREVVMLYFGFNNRVYYQKEIADKFNITQSAVSRIITVSVNKIEKELKKKGLVETCFKKNKVRSPR